MGSDIPGIQPFATGSCIFKGRHWKGTISCWVKERGLTIQKPRISMSRSTFFARLAYPLLTGVPIYNGSRHPIMASCYSWLQLMVRVTYRCIAWFIFSLGLRQAPPLQEILRIATLDNPTVWIKALTFFLDNLFNIYHDYNPQNFSDLTFVPAILGSEKMLAKSFKVQDLPSSLCSVI